MNKKHQILIMVAVMTLAFTFKEVLMANTIFSQTIQKTISLPEVRPGKPQSFSDLMFKRRSLRSFSQGEINLDQVSKLLFAAQGIAHRDRLRTVPSAGALYPLEVYILTGSIHDLESGVYKYQPQNHQLIQVAEGDRKKELARQALSQMWICEAQTILVICAVYERVTDKYSQRGIRYVHIEAGCAAQNVSLAGYSLGLGSTIVGAFRDKGVAGVIQAEKKEKPLIVMPVGLLP